jgi:hypothetical protein
MDRRVRAINTTNRNRSARTVARPREAGTRERYGAVHYWTHNSGIVRTDPTAQNPATLAAGGYITNNTTLHFGDAVYGTNAAAWNFTNYTAINRPVRQAAG